MLEALFRVFKENPYHDERGRFTTADQAVDPDGGKIESKAQKLSARYRNDVTEEEILARLSPDQRMHYERALDRLAAAVNNCEDTSCAHQKDGTWTPERAAIHEKLLTKHFENAERFKPEPGEQPTLMILGGRGGSGKSQLDVRRNPEIGVYDSAKFMTVNADDFKDALRPYGYDGTNAYLYHEESSYLAKQALIEAKKRGLNIVYDTTMSSSPVKRVEAFKRAGYRVEAHYMFAPEEQAAVRALSRWAKEGRLVPPKVILRSNNNEKNFDRIVGRVDKWSVIDNSNEAGGKARLAFTSRGTALKWDPLAKVFKEYDPNQPRDETGKWTATMAVGDTPVTGEFAKPTATDKLIADNAKAIENAKAVLAGKSKPHIKLKPVQPDLPGIPSVSEEALKAKPSDFDSREYETLGHAGAEVDYDVETELARHSDPLIKQFSKEEHRAVREYTETNFAAINRYLGGRNTGMTLRQTKDMDAEIDLLDRALEKATIGTDIRLERKMAAPWFVEQFGGKDLMDLRPEDVVGKVYTEKAFVSTSAMLGANFANQDTDQYGHVRLKIRARSESKGLYVGEMSPFENEKEVLLPRNSAFLIRGWRVGSKGNYAEADVDLL